MRTETLFDRLTRASNTKMFGVTFVLLRLAVGAEFFFAGLAKIGSDWTAAGYLASADGPFAAWFQSLAGSSAVDALNAWGLTLIGVALILGVLVRPASLAGMVLMTLYYFAHFSENTAHGYIDTHIVHILLLALFAAGGAGHAFGLNGPLMQTLRRPNAVARFLLR